MSIVDFQVQLELVMNEPEANDHFTKYLQRSLNLEGYLFLRKLEKLKSPQTKNAEKAQLVIEIYKDFVCIGSQHEVNIDGFARNKVEQAIESAKQLENTEELVVTTEVFAPIETVVSREIREDAFARYVRSEDFLYFVADKGEDYLKRIAADASLKGKIELVFRNSDFEGMSITDKDIAFVLRMNEDSPDWRPLRRTKSKDAKERDHYAYISKTSYHVGDSIEGLHLCKFTGILPYSAEEVIYAISRIDTSKAYDNNQTAWHGVQYTKEDASNPNLPYSTMHSYWEADLHLPFHKHRHCIQMSTIVEDTARRAYIWAGKTTRVFDEKIESVYNSTKQRKNMINCDFVYGYTVYKISDSMCRYVHAVYADVKIKMGLTLFKMVMKKREEGIHEGFLAVCKLHKLHGFSQREKDGGLMTSLNEYRARYLPNENSVKTWEI
jgi:hypothetical protein